MNKIFKVIWNHATQSWVAVSELCRNTGKTKSSVNEVGTPRLLNLTTGVVIAASTLMASATVQAAWTANGGSQSLSDNTSMAMGNGATVDSNGSVGIGTRAYIKEDSPESVAVGIQAYASGAGEASSKNKGRNTAIGALANATGGRATALGADAWTNGFEAVAVGAGSNATGRRATAMGPSSRAEGNGSAAIGVESTASGIGAVALGRKANALEDGDISIGDFAKTNNVNATAIGVRTNVSGDNAIGMGTGTTVTEAADNTVAIGSGITATDPGSVLLGNASSSSPYQAVGTTKIEGDNGASYTYPDSVAGNKLAAGNYVSIGSEGNERQLKNMAAGVVSPVSTDAINGSQLYAVMERVEKVSWNLTTVKKAGTNGFVDNKTGNEKVSVSELVTFEASNNINITQQGNVTTIETTTNPIFKNVNLTDNGNTVTLTPTTNGLTLGDQNNQPVKISNVKAGTDPNDAVNLSQLNATKTFVKSGSSNVVVAPTLNATTGGTDYTITVSENPASNTVWKLNVSNSTGGVSSGSETTVANDNTVTIDASQNIEVTQTDRKISIKTSANPTFETVNLTRGGNTVNFDPTAEGLTLSNVTGSPVKVSGVANGTVSPTSTDAINGSQLYYTEKGLTEKGLNFVGNDGAEIHKNLGATLAIKGGKASNADVSDKNTYVERNANDELIVKFAETPEFKGVTLNTSGNVVNLTTNATGLVVGNNAGSPTKIQNVENGTVSATSKDAVNGSQLYATNQNVTNLTNEVAKGWNLTTSQSAGGNVEGTSQEQINMGELVTIDAGNNINITQTQNKISIATSSKPTFETVNLTRGGNTVNFDPTAEGLTLSNATGSPVKVSGVANGTVSPTSTDAVNGSQLYAVNSTLNAGWKLSTNGDVDNASTVNPVTNRVDLSNTDGNINISQKGNDVVFNLNPTTTLGGAGKDGKDGVDGSIGVKGADGKTGVTLNGKDGSIGINGKDGKDASITVAEGKTTVDPKDGQNGITRVVYETTRPVLDENGQPKTDENGNIITETVTRQVATMDDGLNFIGDKGDKVAKKLGETLAIKGNVDVNAPVTDKNLRVDNEKGSLILKMAKSLTDLTNATFTNGDVKTVVGDNGITVSNTANPNQAPVRLTEKGLDNGNNTITNVAPGVNGTDAVNVDQLEKVNQTANAGWTLTTNNGATSSNVKPSGKVDLSNTDGNININQKGNDVVFNLNPTTTLGGAGKDGKDGVDGSIGVKGADGKTGVTLNGKDGSIGINGKDGKDASITVAEGKTTVDPKDGQNGITRVVYETTRPVLDENGQPKTDENGNIITETVTRQVATMDDGLIFAGDKGETAQKLGSKLTVTGGADLSKLADNNIGVVAENGKLSVKLAKNINLGDNSKVQTGKVSISSDGINAGGKKVSNVADGTISPTSKDAVNGSQLHATNQNVSKVQNEVAKGWNVQADKVANTNGQVVNGKKANVKMGDTVSVKASNNIRVTQDGKNLEIATVPNPTFNSVTTGGLNVAPNSVVNMGGNRVQNVADGKDPTDAVNVRQLKGVENRLNNENKKLRGGIASAAATGLIPQAFIPGKSLVAASATTYRGSNAVAVGYSRASDNGKVLLKVAGSANTQGNVLGGVSLGYQW